MNIDDYFTPEYLNGQFSAENSLIHLIRSSLSGESKQRISAPENLSFTYHSKISRVSILLFQTGQRPIRYATRRKTLNESLNRIISKIRDHQRFSLFDVTDPNACRILLEVVIDEQPCEIKKLKHSANDRNRFEPGIHGLKFSYPGKTGYFMPTDAVLKNISSVKDILLFLSRKTYIAQQTKKIQQRIKLMKSEPIDFYLVKTVAFISFKNNLYPLLRGFPYPLKPFNQSYLLQSITESINWLVKNLDNNGKFVYFYDAITNSNTDIDHPKNPNYYNVLRHSGAIIGLLTAYDLTQQDHFLKAARRAIDYLLSTFKTENNGSDSKDKQTICFPMCNGKSKLGGAGISLVALIRYYQIVKEDKLKIAIEGLVRHILSRIEPDGELFPYYIHPQYNQGKALESMDDSTKKALFSFYYPGEAMLGIALYYQYMPDIDEEFKQLIVIKSKAAMDFLIEQRPLKYPDLFNRVPDDAWLMQAVEEWVKVEGFNKPSYFDFLYKDATAIIEYMRSREDSPLINIGARSEGVIAAYYAAKERGDKEKANYFIKNIIQSAKGLRKTQHTRQSTYAHLYPEKSIGTFSFRMTNQWIRIDSIQHTACLLARLYQSGEVD
ncbi:MAG: protein containing Six-hairpin glycosidase-like domain protein [Pseudomonadota bacterium]